MSEFLLGHGVHALIEEKKENAPKNKYEIDNMVIFTKRRGKKTEERVGKITSCEYGPRKALLRDFGWYYIIVDPTPLESEHRLLRITDVINEEDITEKVG